MVQNKHWQRVGLTLAFLLGFAAGPVAAQEVCGIDSIFYNGFETTGPALSAYPGALHSPGTATSIDGGTLSVSITSPTSGTTVDGASVEVVGTYTGPTDIGITVNGVLAYVQNGAFVVPAVPIVSGSNSLMATAAKLSGVTASSASVSITGSGNAPVITLGTQRVLGLAPFTVGFTPNIGTLPAGRTLASVALDYNGDGTDDYTGPSFSGATLSYTFTAPGVYKARFRVTDNMSTVYTVFRSIVIQDVAVQRGMLCDVYGYMRQSLIANDTTNAALALQTDIRAPFQTVWSSFGSQLPAAAGALGIIADGVLLGNTAQFSLIRKRASDGKTSGHPLLFSMGADGLWRIDSM